ncbi:MAG: hypothetical protein ACR2HM_04140 [Acidimicrobiales bacterium]
MRIPAPDLLETGSLTASPGVVSIEATVADEHSASDQRPADTPFRALLREHLGVDPNGLPVLTERFEPWEHIVVQAGLNAYLDAPGRSSLVVGLIGNAGGAGFHAHPALSQVLAPASALTGAYDVGAPDWAGVATGPGQASPCLQHGVLLVRSLDGTIVAYVRQELFPLRRVCVDVLAPEPDQGARFVTELRRLMAEHNPYRRRVLRLGNDEDHYLSLRFVERPTFEGQEVVLPPGVLDLIEEHTIGIGEQRGRLLPPAGTSSGACCCGGLRAPARRTRSST